MMPKKDTRSYTVLKRECGKKYAQWLDKESVGKGAREAEGIERRKKIIDKKKNRLPAKNSALCKHGIWNVTLNDFKKKMNKSLINNIKTVLTCPNQSFGHTWPV